MAQRSNTRKSPTKYSKAIADEIALRLAEGESLLEISKSEHLPAKSAITRWALDPKHEFFEIYKAARRIQAEGFVDEVISIADDSSKDLIKYEDHNGEMQEKVNTEVLNRSRLRVDTRKWVACKILPKIYGDKIHQEISGPGGEPIKTINQSDQKQVERLARIRAAAVAKGAAVERFSDTSGDVMTQGRN